MSVRATRSWERLALNAHAANASVGERGVCSHVGRAPERECQAGIERRRRHSDGRHEEHGADLGSSETGVVDRLLGGLDRQCQGVSYVQVVAVAEAVRPFEPVGGNAEVALLDVGMIEHGQQPLDVGMMASEHASGELASFCLAHHVLGHGRAGTEDPGCGGHWSGWAVVSHRFSMAAPRPNTE